MVEPEYPDSMIWSQYNDTSKCFCTSYLNKHRGINVNELLPLLLHMQDSQVVKHWVISDDILEAYVAQSFL